jgi:hypothetical protein
MAKSSATKFKTLAEEHNERLEREHLGAAKGSGSIQEQIDATNKAVEDAKPLADAPSIEEIQAKASFLAPMPYLAQGVEGAAEPTPEVALMQALDADAEEDEEYPGTLHYLGLAIQHHQLAGDHYKTNAMQALKISIEELQSKIRPLVDELQKATEGLDEANIETALLASLVVLWEVL